MTRSILDGVVLTVEPFEFPIDVANPAYIALDMLFHTALSFTPVSAAADYLDTTVRRFGRT
jgi:hypothetical protein